ncbi:5'-3' exodeoxyribonuclease [Fragilaria crotonensis]|nr:5'-3' exodeoxyribonuclease [Fragilaria crotonensis]
MGVVGGTLARILRTAGRHVDLSKYSNGITDKRSHTNDDDDTDNKRNMKRRKLRPLRIGVDVSGWIAKVAHGNGSMLVDDRHMTNCGRAQLVNGEETDLDIITTEENRRNYVQLCVRRVLAQILSLQEFSKADILVILDGASPPIKNRECKLRRERKRKAEVERDSAVGRDKTLELRVRSAKVAGAGSSQGAIVEELLQVFRENQIAFIVSPYEADGQLAYLSQSGMVDLVITEDSDLLCHDVQTILFKYDSNGRGLLVQRHDLGAMELQENSLSLLDFSSTMIAIMFVCIGCDYCESLQGIGPVTARDIVRDVFARRNSDAGTPVLSRIFDALYKVSWSALTDKERDLYEERFLAALFAYQHPIIFCPQRAKCVVMNDPPHGSDPLLMEYGPYKALCSDVLKQQEILGPIPERRLQLAIAEGWISPRTQMPFTGVALPKYVEDLFPLAEDRPLHVPLAVVDDRTAPGDQEGSAILLQFSDSEADSDDECPATQAMEQYAAEDTQEDSSTPPDAAGNDTLQLETQALQSPDLATLDGPGTQPFATQQVFIQQATMSTYSPCTQQSDLAQYQQPSQSSLTQHPSGQRSNRALKSLDKRVPILPRSTRSNLVGRSNTKPSNLSQEDPKSPFPSTQSSRTSNSTSSKLASQSTATSDALSPALLP